MCEREREDEREEEKERERGERGRGIEGETSSLKLPNSIPQEQRSPQFYSTSSNMKEEGDGVEKKPNNNFS